MIPVINDDFIPFGVYEDLDPVIKDSMFFPVYITGPSGNGKSTSVEQLCAKYKKNMIRINFNSSLDEEQLIGSKTLKEGNIEIVDGPILIAMRTGSILLLDEIDASNPNSIMCLQSILEGGSYYFKLKDEWITPKDGFNIIATANTKGKGSETGEYMGTNILNEAFLERFAITLEQKYPPIDVEKKIVEKIMNKYYCYDSQVCDSLIKWANIIRKTYDEGGVSENITTRRLIHIVKAFKIYQNIEKSIELSVNRFDISTKTSFIDLYKKLSIK